jgi:phosphoserine phosphatase
MIKAALLDFDGTLVSRDILDVICGIIGKEKESEKINREFHQGIRLGLSGLITRINFLSGVSQNQIDAKLQEEAYLMPGVKKLMAYFNSHKIVTILNSGNIKPVLLAYQKILGITYIVGSEPIMNGNKIQSISEEQFSSPNFKLEGVQQILASINILPAETVAIGDSPADRPIFEFAGTSIAINPRGGIEASADYVIKGDLNKAIKIIEQLG